MGKKMPGKAGGEGSECDQTPLFEVVFKSLPKEVTERDAEKGNVGIRKKGGTREGRRRLQEKCLH